MMNIVTLFLIPQAFIFFVSTCKNDDWYKFVRLGYSTIGHVGEESLAAGYFLILVKH